MSDRLLYHLVSRAEWDLVGDVYRPASLATDGFIHFSTAEQIAATSLRYYAGVADLLVLSVDPERADGEIRWEDLHGTGAFPHLYGALPRSAVLAVTTYVAGTLFED
ncbi:MAG: DUF952 domain-containing protein [Actinomycetota bacterium]